MIKSRVMFFCIINLLSAVALAYAHDVDSDRDHRDEAVIINIYDLDADENRRFYDDEIQAKIDFLQARGYSRVNRHPSFFVDEMHRIVYNEDLIHQDYALLSAAVFIDGIRYGMQYALRNPDGPNFYADVSFQVEGEWHWFLKINHFLEYSLIIEYSNLDTGDAFVLRTFY